MPSYAETTRHSDPDPGVNPWVRGRPDEEAVEIVTYDPLWPARYAELADRIRTALGDAALELEHVGSTAVEGLAAKNVIDIDLTVADSCAEDDYVPALEPLGYVLTIREPSFHEHRMLKLDEPRVNLHVWSPDSPETVRHTMFRDWLREHPADRALYEAAKRSAVPGGGQVMDYNLRKQPIIRAIYDRMFRAAGML